MDPALAVAFLLGALAHYLFGGRGQNHTTTIEQNEFNDYYESEPESEPEDADDDGEEWRRSL